MKQIKNLNTWLSGKTVEKVDEKAVNCTAFYFTDGTAMLVETEHLVNGAYGPVYYEIDPTKPVHTQ